MSQTLRTSGWAGRASLFVCSAACTSPGFSPGDSASAGTSAAATDCGPGNPLCRRGCARDSDCGQEGAVCMIKKDAPKPELLRSVSNELDDAGAEHEDAGPSSPDGGLKKFIQAQGTCRCETRACGDGMVCTSPGGGCITGCDEIKPCTKPGEYCDVFKKKCFVESGRCDSVADCPQFDPRAASALLASCEEHSCRLQAISPEPVMVAPFSAERSVEVTAPQPGFRFASPGVVAFGFHAISPSTMLLVTRGAPDRRSLQERAFWWGFSKGEGHTTVRWDEAMASTATTTICRFRPCRRASNSTSWSRRSSAESGWA